MSFFVRGELSTGRLDADALDVRRTSRDAVAGWDVVLVLGEQNAVGASREVDDVAAAPRPARTYAWLAGEGRPQRTFYQALEHADNRAASWSDGLPYVAGDVVPYGAAYVDRCESLGVAFARAYGEAALAPGRDVMLVPCACFDSGFSTGGSVDTPTGPALRTWDAAAAGGLLDRALGVLDRVLAYDHRWRTQNEYRGAPSAPASFRHRLVAVLWQQGESDAGLSAGAYAAKLGALVARVRAAHPGVPFLCGGLPDGSPATSVAAALRDVGGGPAAATFVDAAGCELAAGDATAFSNAGLRRLASRYVAALLAPGPPAPAVRGARVSRAETTVLVVEYDDCPLGVGVEWSADGGATWKTHVWYRGTNAPAVWSPSPLFVAGLAPDTAYLVRLTPLAGGAPAGAPAVLAARTAAASSAPAVPAEGLVAHFDTRVLFARSDSLDARTRYPDVWPNLAPTPDAALFDVVLESSAGAVSVADEGGRRHVAIRPSARKLNPSICMQPYVSSLYAVNYEGRTSFADYAFGTGGWTVAVNVRVCAEQPVADRVPAGGALELWSMYAGPSAGAVWLVLTPGGRFQVRGGPDANAFDFSDLSQYVLAEFGDARAGSWTSLAVRYDPGTGVLECSQDGATLASVPCAAMATDIVSSAAVWFFFALGENQEDVCAAFDVRSLALYERPVRLGPAALANVAVGGATMTSFDLSWDAPPGVSHVVLQANAAVDVSATFASGYCEPLFAESHVLARSPARVHAPSFACDYELTLTPFAGDFAGPPAPVAAATLPVDTRNGVLPGGAVRCYVHAKDFAGRLGPSFGTVCFDQYCRAHPPNAAIAFAYGRSGSGDGAALEYPYVSTNEGHLGLTVARDVLANGGYTWACYVRPEVQPYGDPHQTAAVARVSPVAGPDLREYIVLRAVAGGAFEFGFGAMTRDYASTWDQALSFGTAAAGAWTLVTVRHAGGTVTAWQDGVPAGTAQAPQPAFLDPQAGCTLEFGTFTPFSHGWAGALNAMIVYDRPLSDAEMDVLHAHFAEALSAPAVTRSEATALQLDWRAAPAVAAVDQEFSADGGATWRHSWPLLVVSPAGPAEGPPGVVCGLQPDSQYVLRLTPYDAQSHALAPPVTLSAATPGAFSVAAPPTASAAMALWDARVQFLDGAPGQPAVLPNLAVAPLCTRWDALAFFQAAPGVGSADGRPHLALEAEGAGVLAYSRFFDAIENAPPPRTYALASSGFTLGLHLRVGAPQFESPSPPAVAQLAPFQGGSFEPSFLRLCVAGARFEVNMSRGAWDVDPAVALAAFGDAAPGAWTFVALRAGPAGLECAQDGAVLARVALPPEVLFDTTDAVALLGSFFAFWDGASFVGDVRSAAWFDAALSDADMAALQSAATGAPALFGATAGGATATSVDVQWAAQAGATAVRIETSPDGAAPWSAFATVAADAGAAHTVTGLAPAATQYARLTPLDGGAEGAPVVVAMDTVAPVYAARVARAEPTVLEVEWLQGPGVAAALQEFSLDGGATWQASWQYALWWGAAHPSPSPGVVAGLTRGSAVTVRLTPVDADGAPAGSAVLLEARTPGVADVEAPPQGGLLAHYDARAMFQDATTDARLSVLPNLAQHPDATTLDLLFDPQNAVQADAVRAGADGGRPHVTFDPPTSGGYVTALSTAVNLRGSFPARTLLFGSEGTTVAALVRVSASQPPTDNGYDVLTVYPGRTLMMSLAPSGTAMQVITLGQYFAPVVAGEFGEVAAGEWAFFALRVAAGSQLVECFQDGALAAQLTLPAPLADCALSSSVFLTLGTVYLSNSFAGDVRAAAWYDAALTDFELERLRQAMAA